MSLVLGIDTASTELGIGLVENGIAVAGFSRYIRNSHAEQITRTVEFMLQSHGVAVGDLTHIGVTVGPGSFTGLRISIAFVKGLVFMRTVPVTAVSSLECAAAAWPCVSGSICVALDARRDQLFWARFARDARQGLQRLSEDRYSSAAECLEASGGDIVLTDKLGFAGSAVFAGFSGRDRVFALEDFPIQRGLACAKIAHHRITDPGEWRDAVDISPQYLQLPAAEQRAAETVLH